MVLFDYLLLQPRESRYLPGGNEYKVSLLRRVLAQSSLLSHLASHHAGFLSDPTSTRLHSVEFFV